MNANRIFRILLVAVTLILFLGLTTAQPKEVFAQGETTWITDFGGESVISMSADGKLIAYTKQQDHPSLGDSNGRYDVYVYDINNSTLQLISKNSSGVSVATNSSHPTISSNGRYVFFEAYDDGQGLVLTDNDHVSDIYVYDRQIDSLNVISTGQGAYYNPQASNDGRYVVYRGNNEIILLDQQTGIATNIYKNILGQAPNNDQITTMAISGDGNRIAFYSAASDLVTEDTNNTIDTFVYIRNTGQIIRISLTTSGTQSFGDTDNGIDHYNGLGISDDGNKVLFVSNASDLLGPVGDTNNNMDVFLRNLETNQTSRVSTDADGVQSNSFNMWPSMSGDGQFAVFVTPADNITGSNNGYDQLIIKNLQNNSIEVASKSTSDEVGNNNTAINGTYAISDDAATIVFNSDATNLVAGHYAGLYVRYTSVNLPPIIVLVHGYKGIVGSQTNCTTNATEYLDVSTTDEIAKNYWNGDDSKSIPAALRADGFRVFVVHLDSGPVHTASLAENISCLYVQLNNLRNQLAPGQKFTIIAHSMGGLIARGYVETDKDGTSIYQGDVANIFTLGTPHQGLPTGLLNLGALGGLKCTTQPVVCEMMSTFINYPLIGFNTKYPERNSQIHYYTIGGNISFLDVRSWQSALLVPLISVASDGLVALSSELGLSQVTQSYSSSESHMGGWSLYSYFEAPPGDVYPLSYYDCARPVLLGNTNGCVDVSPSSVEASSGPQFNTLVLMDEGQLPTGGSTSEEIVFDKPSSAVFAASYDTGSLTMTLLAPGGTIIDEAYALANPSEVTYGSDSTGVFYTVSSATGTWSVVLSNATAPLNYSMFVAFNSDVILTVSTDKPVYTVGETVNVVVALSGVDNASTVINATVTFSDGTSQAIVLTGISNYTGSFVVPDKLSYAEISVAASGLSISGMPIDRVSGTVFAVVAGSSEQMQLIFLPIILK